MFGLKSDKPSHEDRLSLLEKRLANYEAVESSVTDLASRSRSDVTFRDAISTKVGEVEQAVARVREIVGEPDAAPTSSPFEGDNTAVSDETQAAAE